MKRQIEPYDQKNPHQFIFTTILILMVLALHPELKMPTVMPYGVVPDPIQEQVRKFIKTYNMSPIIG